VLLLHGQCKPSCKPPAVQVSCQCPIPQTYLQLGPHQVPFILQPLQAYTTFCLILQYFYVYVAQHISYRTIKVYLAAICLRHIEQVFYDPTSDNLLQLVCRGIRHQQGNKQCIRQPITFNILRWLKEKLHESAYTFAEKLMLWVASTIAFMRVSECINLCWCDATCSEDCISIVFHQSKTDPF